MNVEVELVGGPADGQRMAVECDPMDPPLVLELAQAPVLDALEWNRASEESTRLRRLVYRRAVSPLDTGPLWQYHFDGQKQS